MNTARGHITVVQEERFQLMTDSGQGYLLTLGRDAGIDARDLRRLHDAGAHVVVEYDGDPDFTSGVARTVRAA
jgi:hypothetical protein